MTAGVPTALRAGISEAEAARALAARPERRTGSGRSYASIVRHNVFTLPNTILGVVGIATLALGEVADALFLGIVVANAAIGATQEIRAKRALDRLAALVKPHARVVRDDREREVDAADVVIGDLVRLHAGDQVVADGELLSADALRIDESILTGESEPVARSVGDQVLSGSFAAEGDGAYVVTAVGEASYAERLAGEARAFRHPPSPFQLGLNRLIVFLVGLAAPLCLALSLSLWLRGTSFDDALPTVVSAVINLIPEGLILLASLVYVSGALKLSRHGALTQQLNAIESLASADVCCFDKTGTLTEARLRVARVIPGPGVAEDDAAAALGRFAAASPTPNATTATLAAAFSAEPVTPVAHVPFSSRWRWSGIELADGTLVLGAPELFALGPLADVALEEARGGRRVVALARSETSLDAVDPRAGPPLDARVLGLAVLAERLRSDAAETVAYFADEGVELLVLSGDAPATVAAIARDVGLPAGDAVDGTALPERDGELLDTLSQARVVGRISPQGKKRVVETLSRSGRYVAMVGDGVNDVPALKASRVAIAQGSGAQMARTVADVVLVRGGFEAVPRLVGEGRQILRNMQRVSKIYATKCLFGAFVVLSVGLTSLPYPFLPRHLSLASFFVTGVPPFFLALASSTGPWHMSSYLRETVRFAAPAGFAVAAGVVVAYVLALEAVDLSVVEARTVALSVFVVGSLVVILGLEATDRRRAGWVGAMCATLVGVYAAVYAVPALRDFFELTVPGAAAFGLMAAGLAVCVALLAAAGIGPHRARGRLV